MASATARDDTGAASRPRPLRPPECAITVVTFIPFLRPPRPRGEQPVDDPIAPMLDDLALWGYSDGLTADLRVHLPHRAAREVCGPASVPSVSCLGKWCPAPAVLDVWSIDVGMVTLVDRLDVADGVGWGRLRAELTSRAAKQDALVRAAQLGAGPVDGDRHGGPGVGRGAPLWAQQMIIVEPVRTVAEKQLDAIGRVLTDDGPRLKVRPGMANASLRLGVEACAVANPGHTQLRDALARVVAVQTAIWAVAIDMDRLLKARLRDREAHGLGLRMIEERSVALLGDFERVQRFRSDIDVIEIHLAAPDKPV